MTCASLQFIKQCEHFAFTHSFRPLHLITISIIVIITTNSSTKSSNSIIAIFAHQNNERFSNIQTVLKIATTSVNRNYQKHHFRGEEEEERKKERHVDIGTNYSQNLYFPHFTYFEVIIIFSS